MGRAVDGNSVSESFGYQWKARELGRFEKTTLYGMTMEDEQRAFLDGLGITAKDVKGKSVLDAGCGDGALLQALAGMGAEVVGLDINRSITVAARRCCGLTNVSILQADLSRPCFSPASFDFVWCEGVIVHTPHPFQTFSSLTQLIKPGGRLYLWVYPLERPSIYQRVRDLLIAPYLIPRPLLLYLCYALAAALYPLFPLTGRTRAFRTIAFELFDNLSPRYQWRFREADIRSWLQEAGFEDIRTTGRIGLSARRVV
jgi:ubiquinone/menaquinone biosynthesis C-methylase UbiE